MDKMMLFYLVYEKILENRNEPLLVRRDVNAELDELTDRGPSPPPPPEIPDDLDQLEQSIRVLRDHYDGDVTHTSLVLSHKWPEQFLFYRAGKFDAEIFAGMEFFSEAFPELDLPFRKIGKKSFDDYLTLNETLISFVKSLGEPEDPTIANQAHWLIYHWFPLIFGETTDYNRYWINATSRNIRQKDDEVYWSGRKGMRMNDLVFMYETAPTKAIRSIWRVAANPLSEPLAAWDAVGVSLSKLADIDDIPFSKMRADPVLSQWSVIRRQFQGIVTESVPHAMYNQLLEYVDPAVREDLELEPEPVALGQAAGKFGTEREFEDSVIEPLLRNWGIAFRRQVPVKCSFGTQDVTGFVDFLLVRNGEPFALIESKLRIITEKHLRRALLQARSYALMLGLPGFAVASPEGAKVYRLGGACEELLGEFTFDGKVMEDGFYRALQGLLR